ncbi:hypothetical protein N781_10090 [Pontibacillus halophilus JSM 076056 = DSM 19796]|uniref:Cytosolic protein n=1 Tax=Pontibacillus halophilus JSM 076056 = DSM 19796 TaxID=1385510 RepID=A0A0A5GJG6_9BACI|nr:hypothetical protein [Pontibacillus halophilus]KGX93396.1 hypothetical protein N781_10090 [Pontibacillus halophilus JSM 076056 = DSM 19796]
MKIKQWASTYLTNHAETSEQHWDSRLQTHYFKAMQAQAFNKVDELLSKHSSYTIVAKSEEHGEISVSVKGKRKAFVVVSVIMVQPLRSAVDFSVTTEGAMPFDFGYSTKLIETLYEQLKRELPFIETSLGK